MAEPLIRFVDVHKSFGPKRIYTGLDLSVYEGETLVILGGSGVGKSVMLKMLIGLLPVDRGRILFRGQDVAKMREDELRVVRRQIAMIFQASALFDSISVGANVAYGLHEHHYATMSPAEITERVAWALSLVGLPGTEAMRPGDLSGGMKRRVGLARAIALHPEVLLWDEPTTGLDPINTARINHLMRGMQRALKATSMVVTHDMKSAFDVADRIAMVHRGRIILECPKDEVRAVADPRVRDFIDGVAPPDETLDSLLSD
ncbi:MAG: ATP-binding cassette domain-containing protein [Polyangiaceae bacterium]|nr:ATP-binding cassette domain-containing protein [Polyangiaceae bacterium]